MLNWEGFDQELLGKLAVIDLQALTYTIHSILYTFEHIVQIAPAFVWRMKYNGDGIAFQLFAHCQYMTVAFIFFADLASEAAIRSL